MRKIPLTQGQFALVDDEDFADLSRFNWQAQRKGPLYYAVRQISTGLTRPRQKKVYMHCAIMGFKGVDHADGNGLNNQRLNLRPASRSQNGANRKLGSNSTNGFKGVSLDKRVGRWQAHIRVNKRRICLGRYSTAESAARVYDEAAKKYFGNYCRLNFP